MGLPAASLFRAVVRNTIVNLPPLVQTFVLHFGEMRSLATHAG